MKSREDLLKMLDLDGKEAAPPEATDLALTSTDAPPPKPAASPTALELDEWGRRRGREVLAESERIRKTCLGEDAVADMHGAAFEPDPRLKDDCIDPRRRDFLAQLLQTPDYHALHASTLLKPAAAAIAAATFAEQFAAMKKDEKPDEGEGEDALDREMATLRAVGKRSRRRARRWRSAGRRRPRWGSARAARAATTLRPSPPCSAAFGVTRY
jgi:hypothetical protein